MQHPVVLALLVPLIIDLELSERFVHAGKPPTVAMNATYFAWEAGETVILRCYVTSTEDAIDSVFWIFENHQRFRTITPSSDPDKYSGSSKYYPSLIISNLTFSDVGKYKCAATNEFGTEISKTALFLNVTGKPPNVTAIERYYKRESGQSISLTTSIYSSHGDILSVYWLFHQTRGSNQINVTANERYTGSSIAHPALNILNLTSADTGNYTCQAVNVYGIGVSEQIMLEIKGIPVVDIGSESYNASYGHSVTLECKVWSQTAVYRIYWERNSRGNVINITSEHAGVTGISMEDPGLTITVTTPSDSALYTCVAENMYGIGKSYPTRLKIIGGIPVVRAYETIVSATFGMIVTLDVSVDSAPGYFHIYWTKSMDSATDIIHTGTIGTTGGSLSNPSLTIRFPTVSDVGIYQCHATNPLGIGHSENISLIIEGDIPLVEVDKNELTAQFGDIIDINCTIKSYPNYTKVHWEKRNGGAVTTLFPGTTGIRGSTIETPSLTIIFVTSTDTGYYTCNAENDVGVGTSRAIKLEVNAGPPIVNIGSIFYTTVFGSPVTIDCSVLADPEVRYIFWQKNSNGFLTTITYGVVGTQGISPTMPSLTIMFPSKSDQGEYTCFAVNDLGQRGSLPAILKVSGGLPVVAIVNSLHSAKFGESYAINCQINADPHHTDIFWQHKTDGFTRIIKNDTLGVSGVSLTNPTLTIDFVTTSDAGMYACFAENAVGTGNSKHVNLKVDGGLPVVDVPLTSYAIKHGGNVALSCTVMSIPQHLNVYWVKETEHGHIVLNHGTTGTIGMTVLNPTLSFKPAATTDSGLYTCLAVNVIGTGASRPISLLVMQDDITKVDSSNEEHDYRAIAWISGLCSPLVLVIVTFTLAKVTNIGKPKTVLKIVRSGTEHVSTIRNKDDVDLICTNEATCSFPITHCTWYVKKHNYSDKTQLKQKGVTNRNCLCCNHKTDKTSEPEIYNVRKTKCCIIATLKNVTEKDAAFYSCKARNIIRREKTSQPVELVIKGTTISEHVIEGSTTESTSTDVQETTDRTTSIEEHNTVETRSRENTDNVTNITNASDDGSGNSIIEAEQYELQEITTDDNPIGINRRNDGDDAVDAPDGGIFGYCKSWYDSLFC